MVTRLAHVVFWGRHFTRSEVRRFAEAERYQRVLEIGSGRPVDGRCPYSSADLFVGAEVTRTDVDPSFGHRVLDVTKDSLAGFDTILCASVLEHVYPWGDAVENMYRTMDDGARALIIVPAFYPLHDEPHDYWRFTEHALRRMFSKFRSVTVRHRGFIRRFPTIYAVEVVK